jgi:hypothetical protein
MKKCRNAKITRPKSPVPAEKLPRSMGYVRPQGQAGRSRFDPSGSCFASRGALGSQREDRGRVVSAPKQPCVFLTAYDAARSVRGKWQEWRAAGVWLSKFHKPGTAFALPFNPDDYLWAGPVTLKLEIPEGREMYYRRGHYRRGVRKYLNQLKRGEKLPPVVLLYHEAWDWTIQDGNHRMEAIITHRAPTYEAFLGKPKRRKPIDEF